MYPSIMHYPLVITLTLIIIVAVILIVTPLIKEEKIKCSVCKKVIEPGFHVIHKEGSKVYDYCSPGCTEYGLEQIAKRNKK